MTTVNVDERLFADAICHYEANERNPTTYHALAEDYRSTWEVAGAKAGSAQRVEVQAEEVEEEENTTSEDSGQNKRMLAPLLDKAAW